MMCAAGRETKATKRNSTCSSSGCNQPTRAVDCEDGLGVRNDARALGRVC
jgi:hypothetical protein